MTYKTFNPGDIFTATDAELLMRQGLIVVANAAERDTIPAPTEGMQVYRLDTHQTERHTGTGWDSGDTGWVNLSGFLVAGFTGTLEGRRVGGSAHLRSNDLTGAFPSGSSLINVSNALPAEWRPSQNEWGTAWSDGYPGITLMRSTGVVSISNRSAAAWTSVRAGIHYFVG